MRLRVAALLRQELRYDGIIKVIQSNIRRDTAAVSGGMQVDESVCARVRVSEWEEGEEEKGGMYEVVTKAVDK